MSLLSQTIKNIISGVSQQPPILRHPEQLERQVNGFSTEVGGLQKRPPTIVVKKVPDTFVNAGVKPYVHVINRDSIERYNVVFNGSDVNVVDIEGNLKEVKYANTLAHDYIKCNMPRKNLRVVTVADYSFIVNDSITTKMSTTISPNVWATQGALVNVKNGQYGRTYTILIDGTQVATVTVADGSQPAHSKEVDTNAIASKLVNEIGTTTYNVTTAESWLYITRKDGKEITSVETKDGYNNEAMVGILKTVQKFSLLPSTAPDGFTVEITGEASSNADNYYVKFDKTKGVWRECVKPNLLVSFDATTMPHVLTREADGSFLVNQAKWEDRIVGDDDSNPVPSFIDKKISDVYFFRGRLGFIAEENPVLSKSGDFFNFWMTTATDIVDDDPIDIAVSSNKVSLLTYAVPFAEELYLFSKHTQFVMKADGVLSPKNCRTDPATDFECSDLIKPVSAGRRLYFASERASFSSIKEFYAVQDVSNVKDAQDITSHVPNFVDKGVHKIIPSTTENLLLILSEDSPNKIFVYKYLFIEEERRQASWSVWDFGENTEIYGGDFIGSTLYLLVGRNGSLYVEKMLFTQDTLDFENEPYRVHVDRKITYLVKETDYDEVWNKTVIDTKALYDATPVNVLYIITDKGVLYECQPDANGLVEIFDNLANTTVFIGESYLFDIKFTEIMIKTNDGSGSTQSEVEGRLQLRRFWVNHSESGHFKVTVESQGKPSYSYDMTARILGSVNNKLGSMPVETGVFKVPVHCVSKGVSLTLTSNDPTPLALIGAGWEGTFFRRSERR